MTDSLFDSPFFTKQVGVPTNAKRADEKIIVIRIRRCKLINDCLTSQLAFLTQINERLRQQWVCLSTKHITGNGGAGMKPIKEREADPAHSSINSSEGQNVVIPVRNG